MSAISDTYNQRTLASSVSRHPLGGFEAPIALDAAVDEAGLVWETATAARSAYQRGDPKDHQMS